MAVTTHTISGDLGDLIGADLAYYGTGTFRPSAITVVVESNIPDNGRSVLVAGAKLHLSDTPVTVNSDGTFSQEGFVASDSDDTNIDPETPLQYRVRVDYPRSSDGARRTWRSPWFELTDDTDVATAVEVAFLEASLVSEAITAVEAARDDAITQVDAATADAQAAATAAETARDQAVDISGIATSDDVVAALIPLGGDTTTALNASYASIQAGIDIRTIGAVADEQTATCSISSGSDILTRSSGAWTADDVGKVLSVPDAQDTPDALGRTNMPATIEAFIDATQVQLDRTATATATDVAVEYATDNRAVLQAAFDAAKVGLSGATFIIPDVGTPFVSNQVCPHSNTTILGPGEIKQAPRNWDDADTSSTNGGLLMPWHDTRDSAEPVEHCVNTHIRYVRINGNKAQHYGSIANRTNGEGINFKWARQCSAEFNVIWDVNGDGIDFDYSEDSLALGNHITNASGWGIHHSNGNKNNKLIGNTAVLCGWDQYTESGIPCGGFDCSLDSTDITYIGNTADGCRVNFALGSTGYDPAVYRLISVGNKSLSNAATPAHADSYNGVLIDLPSTFSTLIDFDGGIRVNAAAFFRRAAAANTAFDLGQTGDSVARWTVTAAGTMQWGTGSATRDVSMYRHAADLLGMAAGDSFKIMDGTWNGGQLHMGSWRFWIDTSGTLRMKSGAPSSDGDGTAIGGLGDTATTTNLNAIGNARNTSGKYAGRQVWNTTTNRPVWAVGSAAGDLWVYADGTTAHTPA